MGKTFGFVPSYNKLYLDEDKVEDYKQKIKKQNKKAKGYYKNPLLVAWLGPMRL